MPKAKIILASINPESLRGFEGKIVARESGLVKIVRVYGASERMDYHFIDSPKQMLFGHLSTGFYAVVAWLVQEEEQRHLNIMQSQISTAIKFLPKRGDAFDLRVPEKYFSPLLNVWVNEYDEISLTRL